MVNPLFTDMLNKGVDFWNSWRLSQPETLPNFSEAKIKGVHLSGVDLSRADLSRTNLSRADLSKANLSGANLSGAYFIEVQLIDANLSGADLSGANLSGTDLSRADLKGAKLRGANFYKANLREVDLSGADLSNANLSEANLSGAELSRAIFNGADLSKADLSKTYLYKADFSSSNLSKAKLREAKVDSHRPGTKLKTSGRQPTNKIDTAFFVEAILSEADLSGATLFASDFSKADLRGAYLNKTHLDGVDLRGANLSKAYLIEAHLDDATLIETDLTLTNLSRANLTKADLTKADLTGANLSGTILVRTNLTQAILNNCLIYGISAWDVQLRETSQLNLMITPRYETAITVDNLKIAQFIYLLLNNQELRDIIDTITSKVVLILGRFTPDRKAVLDALRKELRNRNYTPIIFDFDIPKSRDITEVVSLLARLSKFIIADITDAKSVPQELSVIIPDLPSVPVQPLLLATEKEYSMFEHFKRYPWVLKDYYYTSIDELLPALADQIIAPAEQRVQELKRQE